jgi:predicted ribosome quality control (RQC) complex YloA/Tae2 family protein
MLSSYLTLFHAASLLQQRYARTVIAEVYSQEKNTLSLIVYAPEPHTITVCCSPRENYILARAGSTRTHRNTVDLFPALIDRHIESVTMNAADRAVIINVSGGIRLCLEMFASASNIVLCDGNGTVIDAFLNRKESLSLSRAYLLDTRPVTAATILPDSARMKEIILEQFTASGDTFRALKKAAPKLGTLLAEELLHRTNVKRTSCTAEHAVQLAAAAAEMTGSILSLHPVKPFIYFDDRTPLCFSLITLDHLSANRSEQYDDLFTGIQRFISFERSSDTYLQKKKEIASWLLKEREKAQRTIRAVETELAESSRAEKYQRYADLIMMHLSVIEKGATSAELTDPADQDRPLKVPMERSLSPQKNAERYYEKAKKARSGREESAERLLQLQVRAASLNGLLEKINAVTEGISLKNFLQSYSDMVKELGYMTEQEQNELPPFKIFTVEGGFTVYAGKNSANNDLLTFRYAKPNDLWFHARGSSGSHVVLKLGTGHGEPTKKAVEQAASIAAYYSKMKNAKHVPVAMTERKYIHKPKGAPAGTVALDKEKVIFVQPVLPEQKA